MSWNGSSGRPVSIATNFRARRKNSLQRAFLIVSGILVASICVVFFMSSRTPEKVAPKYKLVSDITTTSYHIQTNQLTPPVDSGNTHDEEPVVSATKSFAALTVGSTNPTNESVSITKTNVKPTFESATEMILARIFSTKLGDPVPMVPAIPNREIKDIAKILERNTRIYDDDDPETIEMKKIADLAKDEFVKFVNAGGDDSEFIDYYQTKLQNYHEQWKEAQRSLIEVAREGDYEATIAYMEKVNLILQEKGIKQVKLPPLFRKENQ